MASGCFDVAVRPSLPVRGIDFIMENDIASGKVMLVLQVTDVPYTDSQSDVLVKTFPDVFSVSAITTRAQAKRDFFPPRRNGLSHSCIICSVMSFPLEAHG